MSPRKPVLGGCGTWPCFCAQKSSVLAAPSPAAAVVCGCFMSISDTTRPRVRSARSIFAFSMGLRIRSGRDLDSESAVLVDGWGLVNVRLNASRNERFDLRHEQRVEGDEAF